MVNLLEYFKSYSFRRQFRHQFSTVYHGICRHHWTVLRRLPCKLCKVWASTSQVISEISGKFAWVFQKLFIETSIQTSILNRLPCSFAGTIEWYYGHCPVNSVEIERVLLKLLVRLVVNLLEYFKSYSFRRQFRHQFSTVYHVILQAPLDGITATAL